MRKCSDVRKRHERSHTEEDSNISLARGNGSSSAPLLSVPKPSSIESRHQQDQNASRHADTLLQEADSGSTMDWLDPLDPSMSLDDLDFGSLDTFLNDVMTDWVQGTNNSQLYYDGLMPPTAQQSRSRTPNADVDGSATQTQCVVDQQYSNDILRQLKPVQPQFDTTYSADYLNLCLQMYFSHFHPIFPVVHEATFRPRSWNILLLISMCSIGSLFIGSPEAISQGHQLYARLNKAILASWESHVFERKQSTVPIAQAALLGQTFGLLSGKAADRFMTEVFQGTLLAWGRKIGAFNMDEKDVSRAPLTGSALSNAWKAWAEAEELRRLGLALYIHDTEIAGLFQRDPILRHQRISYPSCTDDKLFHASTAEAWQELYLNHDWEANVMQSVKVGDWMKNLAHSEDVLSSSIRRSAFIAYASLANVGACVLELSRDEGTASNELEASEQGLSKWYRVYLSEVEGGRSVDAQCLQVLYHQYSLALYADLVLLQRALGERTAQVDVERARHWATSPAAACAMFHACLLQQHASEVKLGTVPPIHLPRAIFSAGLAFIAFHRFFPRPIQPTHFGDWKASITSMENVASIAQCEVKEPEQMASWTCDMLSSRLSTLPYNCINLLRKLGQWGVSESFADTLQSLLV